MDEKKLRINAYLAKAGYATRRGADALVEKGQVTINGRRAVLGDKVSGSDEVKVSGFTQKRYRYIAFNKPAGVITHSPQHGERDVRTAAKLPELFPVGRLDKKSRGLIILTDDARVTDRLLSPKYEHEKEYRVVSNEKLPSNFRDRMERGVDIEGYMTKPCKIKLEGEKTFFIKLTEGKKHQIRRMCAALGVTVKDLERISVMNVRLSGLAEGSSREIRGEELKTFLKQLGL